MDSKTLELLVNASWGVRVHSHESGETSLTLAEFDDFEVFGENEPDARSVLAESLRAHLLAYEKVGKPIPSPIGFVAPPKTVTYSTWKSSMVINMNELATAAA